MIVFVIVLLSVACFNLFDSEFLIMQVKNLPLTRPNCGKDVCHFEFELESHVSYPISLTLMYLYIGVCILLKDTKGLC